MSAGWLIDLLLLLGALLLGLAAWRLGRHQVLIDDVELAAPPAPDARAPWRPFPRRTMRRAGFVPERAQAVYWFAKVLLAAFVPLLLLEAGWALAGWQYAAAALLAFFVPELWLWRAMKERQRRIEYALGYFLDQVVAFLMAGMSLDAAIRQAVNFGLPARNPLQRELSLVLREVDAGRDRVDAFDALYQRTGVSELQSLASVFKIGFVIGSPVVATLESHADLLRAREREKGSKRISRKMLAAMVPMTVLNFPMLLLLVFFPAMVQLAKMFATFSF